jgi:hypothetical protein
MMSSAAQPVEIIPGHRESHSGIARKPFGFPPESLFAFSPESCSSSPRNAFRVHPGILFALPRNPHSQTYFEWLQRFGVARVCKLLIHLPRQNAIFCPMAMRVRVDGSATGIHSENYSTLQIPA